MPPRNRHGNRPKKRKNAKTPSKVFSPEDKKRLAALDKGSYYDQEGCERQRRLALGLPEEDSQPQACSSSKEKIAWAREEHEISVSDSSDEELELVDLKGRTSKLTKPEHNWIVNIAEFSQYISEIAVCKKCHGELELFEERNFRAGLATRLQLRCESCSIDVLPASFDTTKRTGPTYEINTRNTLANRVIGKGRSASVKFCSLVGLAPPLNRSSWRDKTSLLLTRYIIYFI